PARDPGAGSPNTRRRAASPTGTGSQLMSASRRANRPHRYTLRGRATVSARATVAAATSGELPPASRRATTASIRPNASAYSARPAAGAAAIAEAASAATFPAALLAMLAGSTTTTRIRHGASSCRSASASAVSAALVASSAPANGGPNRTPIVPITTIRPWEGQLPSVLADTDCGDRHTRIRRAAAAEPAKIEVPLAGKGHVKWVGDG